jgi:hypothetical protein
LRRFAHRAFSLSWVEPIESTTLAMRDGRLIPPTLLITRYPGKLEAGCAKKAPRKKWRSEGQTGISTIRNDGLP